MTVRNDSSPDGGKFKTKPPIGKPHKIPYRKKSVLTWMEVFLNVTTK